MFKVGYSDSVPSRAGEGSASGPRGLVACWRGGEAEALEIAADDDLPEGHGLAVLGVEHGPGRVDLAKGSENIGADEADEDKGPATEVVGVGEGVGAPQVVLAMAVALGEADRVDLG